MDLQPIISPSLHARHHARHASKARRAGRLPVADLGEAGGLIPSDSAEPFGPEPFGRELIVERLTAEGLVVGHQGRGNLTF
jgi:hypothetical protein